MADLIRTRRRDETPIQGDDYRNRGPAALAHALSFTLDDLSANRRGAMSERQAWRLRREVAIRVAQAAAVWLSCFVILTLCFNRAALDGVFWALALTSLPFLINVVPLSRLVRDANALRVEKVSGYVAAERGHPALWAWGGRFLRLRPGYYYRAGAQRFHVSRAAYLALHNGFYTLYYTPAARRVVSAEPLPGAALGRRLPPRP